MPRSHELGSMKRSGFLTAAGLLVVASAAPSAFASGGYSVEHSDAQWRAMLGDARYEILRQGGTESPNSSALIAEKRHGVYRCAGCGLTLFTSSMKYDSGEGWPSFWNVLPNAVSKQADYQLIAERTEVHCRRCGGHLGHLFDDGPAPTHLRYCIDGLALQFVPTRNTSTAV